MTHALLKPEQSALVEHGIHEPLFPPLSPRQRRYCSPGPGLALGPLSVHWPHGVTALVQPESRAAFQRLLKQGWVDAIRALHPDDRIFTFWDYMRNRWQRDAGLRLDHLLLSRKLARRLVDAGVDRDVRGREGASDHAPVWIELKPE